MISHITIILGSAGPIFAIFSPNESVLGADDQSQNDVAFCFEMQEQTVKTVNFAEIFGMICRLVTKGTEIP